MNTIDAEKVFIKTKLKIGTFINNSFVDGLPIVEVNKIDLKNIDSDEYQLICISDPVTKEEALELSKKSFEKQLIINKPNTMNTTDIAKVAHELNRAYCQSIGDNSQPEWGNAPEWQKSSAVNGVQFHLDNPEATPSASHESWLKQKTEEGWKYGEVKNPETKEHPCFVPYEQLPVEQKAKDYIFRQTIHSLKPFLN